MAAIKNKNDIHEISGALGLNHAEILDVIERIKGQMFYVYYRHDASADWEIKYNLEIKKAYKKFTGREFDAEFAKKTMMQFASIALMGPPGHGKTTAYKEAAKWFAKETGLEFIENADINDYVKGLDGKAKKQFKRKSLVFVSQEFSGEVSKAAVGLPMKENVVLSIEDEVEEDKKQVTYVSNMMPGRFRLMNKACASVLLLDDFVNASQSVQNIGLSIANERRFQDMSYRHSYIGLTGNLGAIDGTHTSKFSSALVSRMETYVVSDKPKDFAKRLIERTADTIGDLGMAAYLKLNEQEFWKMPTNGSFPCPRTWDAAIEMMRREVHAKGSLEAALDEISKRLSSSVGVEASAFAYSYLSRLVTGAEPLAKKMIEAGEWDTREKQKFKDGYGDGYSDKAQEYAYQFSSAMADYVAQKIVLSPLHKDVEHIYAKINNGQPLDVEESKKLEETRVKILKEPIERYLLGMSNCLQESALAFGVQQLVDKLSYQLVPWSETKNNSVDKQRYLKFEVKQAIVKISDNLAVAREKTGQKDFNAEHMYAIIDAITNTDRAANKAAPKVKKKVA